MKIEHDFHIHTELSLCADKTATVEYYIAKAKELGLKKLGFSNHYWQDDVEGARYFYKNQNFGHVELIKPELEKYKGEGIELYFGCECEYNPDIGVSMTEATAEKFDYILIPNSHTHETMPKDYYEPYEKHRDFMIDAYNRILDSGVSKYITAMAHPFEAVCCPYDNQILIRMISDDCFKQLFDKTAEKNIAFELNIHSMNGKTKSEIEAMEQIRMFRLAKECGCKFIFGSDSHKNTDHDFFSNCEFLSELLELKENDIAEIAR